MNKQKKHTKNGDSFNKQLNIMISIVIVIVLGLGVYAIAPIVSQKAKDKANQSSQSSTEQQQETVQTQADKDGISVDEYKKKYSLGDSVTATTDLNDALTQMTLDNFAKAQQKTTDDIRKEYQLPTTVTNDETWGKAMLEMPSKIAFGGEDKFQEAKQTYGLDASITGDTRWGDVLPIVQQKMMEMYSNQQGTTGNTATEPAK